MDDHWLNGIDLLLQVALSEYPPSSFVQDRINNSIDHYLQPLLLDCDTEKSPAQLGSLELPHEMAKQFTLHLNRLIPRLILANQPIIQHKCKWSCDKIFPSSVQLFQPVFIERDELGFISACLSADADVETEIVDGKSEEIELAFAECLSAKPESTRTASSVNFPFSTLPTSKSDVLRQPIGQDIIKELKSSWEKYHQSKDGKVDVMLVDDIQDKLESCVALAKERAEECWLQLEEAFTPNQEDVVNRSRRAAGLSTHIAPRALFPWLGRSTTDRLDGQTVMGLLSNYIVYVVYLQKGVRCLEMLNTLDTMEEGENKNYFAVRLIREIQEVHCSGWRPRDHRKWLLFEVESNLMIRRMQSDVALSILAGDKRVLQMNMGEGKTSVISP